MKYSMEVHSYDGIKRVLLKLEISINNGNYYEAHQMYRTLYFRYDIFYCLFYDFFIL
jgi:hypothetical protein